MGYFAYSYWHEMTWYRSDAERKLQANLVTQTAVANKELSAISSYKYSTDANKRALYRKAYAKLGGILARRNASSSLSDWQLNRSIWLSELNKLPLSSYREVYGYASALADADKFIGQLSSASGGLTVKQLTEIANKWQNVEKEFYRAYNKKTYGVNSVVHPDSLNVKATQKAQGVSSQSVGSLINVSGTAPKTTSSSSSYSSSSSSSKSSSSSSSSEYAELSKMYDQVILLISKLKNEKSAKYYGLTSAQKADYDSRIASATKLKSDILARATAVRNG